MVKKEKLFLLCVSVLFILGGCGKETAEEKNSAIDSVSDSDTGSIQETDNSTAGLPEESQTDSGLLEEQQETVPMEPVKKSNESGSLIKGGKGWEASLENGTLSVLGENADEAKQIGNAYQDEAEACFVDENTAYLAYYKEADPDVICIESTQDGGTAWDSSELHYTENAAENTVFGIGTLYLSMYEKNQGYLLYCSDPGAGQMTKLLFYTEDGGKSFSAGIDLTSLHGYPTGICFESKEHGYLAVTYHGQTEYLYETADAGETWQAVWINDSSLSEANYVDGFVPSMDGDRGVLILKCVSGQMQYRIYQTADHGAAWEFCGTADMESVKSYLLDGDVLRVWDTDGNEWQIRWQDLHPQN